LSLQQLVPPVHSDLSGNRGSGHCGVGVTSFAASIGAPASPRDPPSPFDPLPLEPLLVPLEPLLVPLEPLLVPPLLERASSLIVGPSSIPASDAQPTPNAATATTMREIHPTSPA